MSEEREEQQFLPVYRRRLHKPNELTNERRGDLNYLLMKDVCPQCNVDYLCQVSVDDPDHRSVPCFGRWYKNCAIYLQNK